MKKAITVFTLSIIAMAWGVSDPNTPTILPRPGTEKFTRVDGNTIRKTTSVDIKKSVYIAQKKRNLQKIERLEKENARIDAILAQFK